MTLSLRVEYSPHARIQHLLSGHKYGFDSSLASVFGWIRTCKKFPYLNSPILPKTKNEKSDSYNLSTFNFYMLFFWKNIDFMLILLYHIFRQNNFYFEVSVYETS